MAGRNSIKGAELKVIFEIGKIFEPLTFCFPFVIFVIFCTDSVACINGLGRAILRQVIVMLKK